MQAQLEELPVRGDDAIEILVNDHQVIKQLLGTLTTATERSKRKHALERLKAALTLHNATEENLVYPALAQIAGKHMKSGHLYHETAATDMLIFELDTLLYKDEDAQEFGKKAEKLQDSILEHIDDEENSAFPDLQKNSEPQEASMLTEAVQQFRKQFHYTTAG